MRKTEKSEAIMGRKYSGGVFHGLKEEPRLFPSLHGVQTVGWTGLSAVGSKSQIYFSSYP